MPAEGPRSPEGSSRGASSWMRGGSASLSWSQVVRRGVARLRTAWIVSQINEETRYSTANRVSGVSRIPTRRTASEQGLFGAWPRRAIGRGAPATPSEEPAQAHRGRPPDDRFGSGRPSSAGGAAKAAPPAAASGRPPGFWGEPFKREEGMGAGHKRAVVVEARVAAPLVVTSGRAHP